MRVNGRTTNAGGYGPLDISVPINAGVTYHVALVQDALNNSFSGVLNGVQFGSAFIGGPIGSHPNRNAIGAIDQNIYFHDDGPGNAPGRPDGTFAFQGAIAHLAFYNRVIPTQDLLARYEATSLPISEQFRLETLEFLEQIDSIVEDNSYRGINLLNNEDLNLKFNTDILTDLNLEGIDFTFAGFDLANISYQKPSQTAEAISDIENAIEEVRDYKFRLANALKIINVRQDFTQSKINTHRAGADDLTLADINEEAANQLASQTRLDIGMTALSLAGASQTSILDLFSNGTGQVI